jgi:hypothetical protein
MRCPDCRDEYEAGVAECADCHVPLVPSDRPLPPRVDALLGTFHPAVAEQVTGMLTRRRIAAEQLRVDDRVEIIVDREWRDELRAELVVNYPDLVGRLPTEERYELLAAGGSQPGWFDAPRGAWIDRQGRLQVDPTEDEQAEADATRTVGPTLLTLGAVLALFGWYAGGSHQEAVVLLGIAMVVGGVFSPR